jgi:murein endopeptidase
MRRRERENVELTNGTKCAAATDGKKRRALYGICGDRAAAYGGSHMDGDEASHQTSIDIYIYIYIGGDCYKLLVYFI